MHLARLLFVTKEIIKRIDIDPIEASGLIFLWIIFGGPLFNSFLVMVLLYQDVASFIVFVFFLIIFLIASPLLFSPVIRAYNKFINDNKKNNDIIA